MEKFKTPEPREKLTVSSALRSEKKESHQTNQDSLLYDTENLVFGVFDGMGGEASGEIASRIAKDSVEWYLKDNCKPNMPVKEIENIVEEAVNIANETILEDVKKNPRREHMGTTATVLKIHSDEEGEIWGVVGHVGDSRLYLLDDEGDFRQITTDDDWIGKEIPNKESADLIRKALDDAETRKDLGSEARRYFDTKYRIGKALGRWSTLPTIISFKINKGARIVITCDGINVNLTTKIIKDIVIKGNAVQKIADSLVEEAIKASKDKNNFRHHQDDMSAIAVEVPKKLKK